MAPTGGIYIQPLLVAEFYYPPVVTTPSSIDVHFHMQFAQTLIGRKQLGHILED